MKAMQRLLDLMQALREPERGCPWDIEQTFASIAPYTIEEAYEVVDAIERGDLENLKAELGDLLFQVVFHARMAEESGAFDFRQVVTAVCEKMERRHPHVFGDARVASAEAQAIAWEIHKTQERQRQGDRSALAGIGCGLPEWLRAVKLHQRAARVGFDWPDIGAVLSKVDEEIAELKAALMEGNGVDQEEELGDLLFSVIALSRHAGIDPGRALRAANAKFERRFRALENLALKRGVDMAKTNPAQLDWLWEAVKADEQGPGEEI